MPRMSMGIEPIAAPHAAKAPDERQRYDTSFGGAVTYSGLVQEKLRVDPVAIAQRTLNEPPRSEKPRQSIRAQRLAEEEAAYDARRDARPGAYVDIEV